MLWYDHIMHTLKIFSAPIVRTTLACGHGTDFVDNFYLIFKNVR